MNILIWGSLSNSARYSRLHLHSWQVFIQPGRISFQYTANENIQPACTCVESTSTIQHTQINPCTSFDYWGTSLEHHTLTPNNTFVYDQWSRNMGECEYPTRSMPVGDPILVSPHPPRFPGRRWDLHEGSRRLSLGLRWDHVEAGDTKWPTLSFVSG